MTDVELSVAEQADLAEANRRDIVSAQMNIQGNLLVLGAKLKDNRDLAYYKLLGYDTFEEFLGSPEIAFGRSKAYDLIHIYELYILKLGVPKADLLEAGTTKLLLVAPQIEQDETRSAEWIGKAKSLSKSDLRQEIQGREFQSPKSPTGPPPLPAGAPAPPFTREQYLALVKLSPCIVCGGTPVDAHHFPRTRVRGGEYNVIPLCRRCHTEFHTEPMKWMWDNRQFWGGWFYSTIFGKEKP